MKTLISAIAVAGALLSTNLLAEDEIRLEGAAPGQWTMDFDAAKQVAAEKNLPILLDFSGSDWCGWCKLMERQVFSQKEWTAYATNSIMQVLIDFPSDKSRIPGKYIDRNNKLKDQFEIAGFPTFIILDSDGKTVLGQLSAGENKTPQSFIAELRQLFVYRSAQVDKYTKDMAPEKAEKYRKTIEDINSKLKLIDEKQELIMREKHAVMDLAHQVDKLKEQATELRAAAKGEDQLKAYKQLKADLKTAREELEAWLATRPERSQENGLKYKAMQAKIETIATKLNQF
jgi:thioredoxin-related protein